VIVKLAVVEREPSVIVIATLAVPLRRTDLTSPYHRLSQR
jgi:hypothetical protein